MNKIKKKLEYLLETNPRFVTLVVLVCFTLIVLFFMTYKSSDQCAIEEFNKWLINNEQNFSRSTYNGLSLPSGNNNAEQRKYTIAKLKAVARIPLNTFMGERDLSTVMSIKMILDKCGVKY